MKKVNMSRFHVVYTMIGIFLVTGLIVTGKKGLDTKNYSMYEYAQTIETKVEEKIWRGVRLSDYPVAIKQKETEYVFYKESVSKRKEVLPVLAGTAYEVDGQMNVLLPSYNKMQDFGELAVGMGDESKMIKSGFGFSEDVMTDEEYVAIMYHETFHAYQFTYHPELRELGMTVAGHDADYNMRLDQDEVLKRYYAEEGKLLYASLVADSDKECIKYAKKYINQREQRTVYLKKNMTEDEYVMLSEGENFYELVEGTAYYIQMKTLALLDDTETYNQSLDSVEELGDGRHKYYESGMAMGMILEKLGVLWKDGVFDSDESYYEQFSYHIYQLLVE